ncbi:type IV secretion system protein VirB10 [Neisseria dumasiana]|nr:type IV secretion system protein VirB10 [Neisseria dumasiana]UOO84356.1 type IV secretion system protein VirB10 [Neisseria dumasiana]
MSRNHIPSEEDRQTLQERIGDNTIERGIPTNLNTKKKNSMLGVVLFLIGLMVAGLAVGGLMMFAGGSDEAPVKKEEETVNNKAGSKSFASEQEEILEMTQKPETTASEPAEEEKVEAASSVSDKVTINEPPIPAQVPPPPDERLDSDLSPQGLGNSGSNAAGQIASIGERGSMDGNLSTGSISSPSDNALTAKLRPGAYQTALAENRGDLTYVLGRGTGIPCVTTSKIVTTHPGLTRCQVTKDVYSANGKTLLVERGSTVIGEQTSALTQGQARVFVLWNTLETPEGIRVAIDSPGGDALGASGHPAKVKHHFWRRIGGAVMISMIQNVVAVAGNRRSSKGTDVSFESTTESAQDLATEILKNSINIPPTGYVNQGTEIMIFAARDVDFSGVYENITVPDTY